MTFYLHVNITPYILHAGIEMNARCMLVSETCTYMLNFVTRTAYIGETMCSNHRITISVSGPDIVG